MTAYADSFKNASSTYMQMRDVVLAYNDMYLKALGLEKSELFYPIAHRVRTNGIHEVRVCKKGSAVDVGTWVSLEWLQVVSYGRNPTNHQWFRDHHVGKVHPDHVAFKREERHYGQRQQA